LPVAYGSLTGSRSGPLVIRWRSCRARARADVLNAKPAAAVDASMYLGSGESFSQGSHKPGGNPFFCSVEALSCTLSEHLVIDVVS
jgi:hypothetical protein